MRCLHCGKELDNDALVCPYCNHDVTEETREIDLPIKEEDSFDVGKTRAISPIRDNELSLIDDINKEIEKKEENNVEKKEKLEEKEETSSDNINEVNVGEVNLTKNDVNSVLETRESFKKRKIILIVCVLLTVIAVVLTVVVISKDDKNESIKINGDDYLETYDNALDKYYETGEIDDLVIILQANKNDDQRMENIQRKTRISCDSWLLSYVGEKIDNKEEFEKLTKDFEKFLYGLNNYAVATVDDKKFKALTDSDYLEVSNQLSSLYEDGLIFFDALELYNKKDYNKAYSNFELVDNKNVYYDNSITYKERIIENILALLDQDIEKLKNGIDDLSNDEKLARYVAMEEIIMKYDDAYVIVNLKKNELYNNKLKECREKIDEYSNLPSEEE